VSWDPGQYLKFAGERARPAIDLIGRIPLAAPRAIVDLGCGAGNVTRLLAERWPEAEITGVDRSAAMLVAARESTRGDRRFAWIEAELATWQPGRDAARPDVLFSNAALHWLDDHSTLFPRLLAAVAADGVLAVQMPCNFGAPSHVALRAVATGARWRGRLAPLVRPSPVAAAADYFRWLAPYAATLDLWDTEYLHVLVPTGDGEHPVVAWTIGTALTPFFSVLDAEAQQAFLTDYRRLVARDYPPEAEGRVLFPFRRRFLIARPRA